MLEIIIDHDIIVNEDDEKLRKLYNEMEPKSFQCCSIKKKKLVYFNLKVDRGS